MPAKPRFFDTHAHINYPQFADRIDEVLVQCQEHGISRVIAIATDLESSHQIIGMAQEHEQILAVPGWHPCDALNAPGDIRNELRELSQKPGVVALGETGLDFYRMPSQSEEGATEATDAEYVRRQRALFQQHLEVAAETGLNLVIHQRSAFDETVEMLLPFADQVRGVFHCFVGTPAQQQKLQQIGSIVSFTGIVTFKNAGEVRDTVKATPLDQLMLETDCPYLAPVPYRGKTCQPFHVWHVAQTIAEVKGVTLDELSEATCATARQFFRGLD